MRAASARVICAGSLRGQTCAGICSRGLFPRFSLCGRKTISLGDAGRGKKPLRHGGHEGNRDGLLPDLAAPSSRCLLSIMIGKASDRKCKEMPGTPVCRQSCRVCRCWPARDCFQIILLSKLAASKGHFLLSSCTEKYTPFEKKPFSLPLAQNHLFRNSPWSRLPMKCVTSSRR